jgi:hypothetical protein
VKSTIKDVNSQHVRLNKRMCSDIKTAELGHPSRGSSQREGAISRGSYAAASVIGAILPLDGGCTTR